MLFYIYCKNIPSSSAKPFQLLMGKQVIFKSTESIGNTPIIVEADIPDAKYATNTTTYLQILIPEANVDDLSQYSLTNKGQYLLVLVDPKMGLLVRQRFDDKWSLGDNDSHAFNTKEKDRTFDYSSNPMDPKIENYKKTVNVKEYNPKDAQQVIFYFQNIPASEKEPTQVFVDKHLVLLMKQSTPMNQQQKFIWDLPEPRESITARVHVRSEGYDVEQQFDMHKGNCLQFAIVDDEMRVAQNDDGKFPSIPFQFKKPKETDTTTSSDSMSKASISNADAMDVFIYIVGADATSVKKFQVKINGNVVQKWDKPIPKDQILAIRQAFKKPSSGNLVIKFSATMPAKGFFEPIESEFDITKEGRYIKMEVTENNAGTSVDFVQQTEDFKFEGETSRTDFKKIEKPVDEVYQQQHTRGKQDAAAIKTATKSTTVTTTTTTTPPLSKEQKEIAELEKLGDLLKRGILSQEEFQFKKKKLLGL